MDTLSAFAMGAANQGNPLRVFDWDRAAELIRDRKPAEAGAGLGDDWEYTGGRIWADGKPVPASDTYTFLQSNWAIPELDMDGDVQECWRWSGGSGWDASTYWPNSARAILAAGRESAAEVTS